MAFRIQDPVSGLFWEVDDGYRLRLREKGTIYVQNSDGSLQNPASGLFVSYAGNQIVEDPAAKPWVFTPGGGVLADSVYYVCYSEADEGLGISGESAPWVRVGGGVATPPAPTPVAAPVVEEPEPEAEAEEPEPESEEDVPVARSAALIEEALNAQAAAAAEDDKDIE